MKRDTPDRLRGLLLATLLLATAAAAQPEREVLLGADDRKAGPPAFEDADRRGQRQRMVESQIQGRDVDDAKVIEAMRTVPRHRFVPETRRPRAYQDGPLPIGHGQTISQPYIVARMTELLQLEGDERVLEVGTGSAYQAAILAQIAREVVTIEIIRPLATSAAERLERLGYDNVTVLHGDGYYGWGQRAPYPAIVVTAAARHVPPPLVEQLAPGGRMVIPVGKSAWTQNLLLVKKDQKGEVTTRNLMPVRFVPLTGDH